MSTSITARCTHRCSGKNYPREMYRETPVLTTFACGDVVIERGSGSFTSRGFWKIMFCMFRCRAVAIDNRLPCPVPSSGESWVVTEISPRNTRRNIALYVRRAGNYGDGRLGRIITSRALRVRDRYRNYSRLRLGSTGGRIRIREAFSPWVCLVARL